MKRNHAAFAALVLLLQGAVAGAADLKKIDRTLAKEPPAEQPKYCLLVFGPQATTRVWLIADDDVLYVDRNGNGDLTDPGERVRFSEFREAGEGPFAAERTAEVADIHEGKLKHERLVVTQQRVNPKYTGKVRSFEVLRAIADKNHDAVVYQLSISLELRPRPGDPIRIAGRVSQYAGMDGAGFLQFADRPDKAPIVHFRGPMQMGLYSPQRLVQGLESGELVTVVGSAGLGAGTFASVPYAGLISGDAAPVAEIEFPPAVAGSSALKARTTLPHRC